MRLQKNVNRSIEENSDEISKYNRYQMHAAAAAVTNRMTVL